MKYSFYYIISFFILFSCSDNSLDNPNCRFLLNINVNETINLTFYPELQFSGSSEYIPNIGNGGVILARVGETIFAWDAADPNHPLSSCSVLQNSGLTATCQCEDENEYSLSNGLPLKNAELRCPLKNYRVEKNGNNLLIFN